MTAKPANIYSDVNKELDNVVEFLIGFKERNTFEIKSFEAKAKKLLRVDAAQAYCLYGRIAAICGEVDAMRAHFDNAIRLRFDIDHVRSKMIAETNFVFASEAKKIFANYALVDFENANRMIHVGLTIGAFDIVDEYIQKAKTMNLNLDAVQVAMAGDFKSAAERIGIDSAYVTAVIDMLGEVLRENGLFFYGHGPVFEIEGTPRDSISMYFKVGKSGAEVARLTEQLAEKIAVSDLPIYDNFHVAFRPVAVQ